MRRRGDELYFQGHSHARRQALQRMNGRICAAAFRLQRAGTFHLQCAGTFRLQRAGTFRLQRVLHYMENYGIYKEIPFFYSWRFL